MRGKNFSCNSNRINIRDRNNNSWYNEIWDTEKGTEQAGKTDERKDLYSSINGLNTWQRGLLVRPTNLIGERIDVQLIAEDSNGGNSHSF